MTSETKDKYCPICGKPVMDPTYNRFGEWYCSEEHVEPYVQEVRAQKAQAAVHQGRPLSPASGMEEPWDERGSERGWSRRRRWFGRRRGCR
jgi:hypothetical protein